MPTIPASGRETQLYVHTMAAALLAASQIPAILLDLDGIDEPSPAAQKAAVSARLAQTMGHLEAVIRSKKTAPAKMSPATAGRILAERDEKYDAVGRTYTPGPGFSTLIKSLFAQTLNEAEAALESVFANTPTNRSAAQ